MALGSSCPEILLNVLEVCMDNFYAGALGPSTIVGSAAFNLMCITAVCVIALPAGETRTLKNLNVFLITATFSVLAYVWLLVIVVFWTPDVITIVEGVITLVLMFILVLMAYIADTRAQGAGGGYKLKLTDVQTTSGKMDAAAWEAAKDAGLVVKGGEEGAQTAEALAEALQKKFDGGRSRAHYRHQSLMKLPGHGQLSLIFKPATLPRSDTATLPTSDRQGMPGSVEAQKQGSNGETNGGAPSPQKSERSSLSPSLVKVFMPRHQRKDFDGTIIPVPPQGVIRWHEETVNVIESIGKYTLSVERVGGTEGEVSVHYQTKDQQAVGGCDYEHTSGTITFADGDSTPKEINIVIYDDDELEKDETFTVVLSELTGGAIFDVDTDGGVSEAICTVTIINDDARSTTFAKAMHLLRMDTDQLALSRRECGDNFRDALTWPEKGTGPLGIVLFLLTLPWRLMFSFVPPPNFGGGWPCFFIALLFIGFQVRGGAAARMHHREHTARKHTQQAHLSLSTPFSFSPLCLLLSGDAHLRLCQPDGLPDGPQTGHHRHHLCRPRHVIT